MITTKISSKYQIVIPKIIRKAVQLDQGQLLIITYTEQGYINLKPAPKNLEQIIGIGKNSLNKEGGGKKYLKKERQSWKD